MGLGHGSLDVSLWRGRLNFVTDHGMGRLDGLTEFCHGPLDGSIGGSFCHLWQIVGPLGSTTEWVINWMGRLDGAWGPNLGLFIARSQKTEGQK